MIQVENVSFQYSPEHKAAVQGLHFEVKAGEIFGLLGPSGAGKSTTLSLLTGILKNYEGSVKVLGVEMRSSTAGVYERIGVAFETPDFYSKFTAMENLKFFQSLYQGNKIDPMELLEQVGLAAAAHQRVGFYSKGMKMRLNFCRALMHQPQILFLDEPASGLDPANIHILKRMIREFIQDGKAVFLTTHHMQIADELCDHIGFMAGGSLSMIAPPRELKIKYGRKQVRIEYEEGGKLCSHMYSLDGIGTNQDFISTLQKKNIQTIHTQEASLEDIFVQVTGSKLR